MNKVITGMLVMLVMSVTFLGLSYSFYTMTEEFKYEPITVGTSVVAAISEAVEEGKEIERLNYTYTISSIMGFNFLRRRMRYRIMFEEVNLDKVHTSAAGVTGYANEEFGSALKAGQKLTVKEIEENLIY